jgi:hypothetical protein
MQASFLLLQSKALFSDHRWTPTHHSLRNVKGLIGRSTSQVSFDLPMMLHRFKLHPDCKDSIISSNWKPGWVVECRRPSFLVESKSPAEEFKIQLQMSAGVSLSVLCFYFTSAMERPSLKFTHSWGNVPAMDIVNLPSNERDPKTDLSLAFAGRCFAFISDPLNPNSFQPRVTFGISSQQSMPLNQIIPAN